MRRLLLFLTLVLLPGCGGGSGTPAQPSPTQQSATSLHLAGAVVDRVGVGQEPIDGSTIKLMQMGVVVYTAPVVRGRFEVASFRTGTYDVKIEGPSHVTYELRSSILTAGEQLEFGVLKWNSSRFGVAYTEVFHQFFHSIARTYRCMTPPCYETNLVVKWDITRLPPAEIYVANETLDRKPLPAAEVARLVERLAGASGIVSSMFCGRVGPLPVRSGPTLRDCRQTPCIDSVPPGTIHFSFSTEEGPNGAAGGWQQDGYIKMGFVNLSEPDSDLKTIMHELFHVVFAGHCFYGSASDDRTCPDYPGSLSSYERGTGDLSAAERLAACLVYDDRTTVGNRYPDINFFVKR